MRALRGVWFAILVAIASATTRADGSPIPGSHVQDQTVAKNDAPSTDSVVSTTATPTDPAASSTPSAFAVTPPAGTPDEAVAAPDDIALDSEQDAAPFQSIGIGQQDPDALISEAMAALESLRQGVTQISTTQCNPAGGGVGSSVPAGSGIASISSIPVDSSGAQLQAIGGTVHNVTIGDGFTRFTPAIIKANPGDTIMFNWLGKNNHSVTESDALGSCSKSALPEAFDSGVQPPGTVWNLTIPAEARGLKFFYCKVAMHCAKTGMNGVIITPQ